MNVCIVRLTCDNKVLLVKNIGRQWEFPGGKTEQTKDRFGKSTCLIDLCQAAFREFNEEVGIHSIVGHPTNILYEPTHKTVFFVYTNQKNINGYVCNDRAIEDIAEYDIQQLSYIEFSFESDKELIYSLIKNKNDV